MTPWYQAAKSKAAASNKSEPGQTKQSHAMEVLANEPCNTKQHMIRTTFTEFRLKLVVADHACLDDDQEVEGNLCCLHTCFCTKGSAVAQRPQSKLLVKQLVGISKGKIARF